MPVASSDYGPYDNATTGPGSDKGNIRLTGQAHKKLVDPDYLGRSSGAANSPDYQRTVPPVPVIIPPKYTELTKRPCDPNTINVDPDYLEINE